MTGGDDERVGRGSGAPRGRAPERDPGRQARLGAALRANLARRKAQARALAAGAGADHEGRDGADRPDTGKDD